ncbi:MAG: succinyldiaminopimelate transaminase [Casimicrobiaceae bacterium]
MNPRLGRLQAYPFERLRQAFAGIVPDPAYLPINLSIGEPRHATPPLVFDALQRGLTGLANYPMTAGTAPLREAIAAWLRRRHGLAMLDGDAHVLPVLGSREALFAFAQTILDPSRPGATVLVPNPFYQIYEGAALLGGAEAYYVNADPARGYRAAWHEVPDDVLGRTQLAYVCSPDNPTGRVMTLEEWRQLFALADRHGFVIAADECYSEIYFDEARPPLGALAAAQALGRADYRGLISFGSLSKRSNVPGMRSGFVAGDPTLIKAFLLYRTYHGSAMSPPVAAASIAAWSDEAHVRENRRAYAEKFTRLHPILSTVLPCTLPEAGFYLWARTSGDDVAFAKALYAARAVTVLPGSFFARSAHGANPGAGFIRIALVASLAECTAAVERMVDFVRGGAAAHEHDPRGAGQAAP